jgi:hypothetical protein
MSRGLSGAGMRFGILGALEVGDGERPVAVGGPQQRGLLALLVLEVNRVVSTDRLVDCLWEESPLFAAGPRPFSANHPEPRPRRPVWPPSTGSATAQEAPGTVVSDMATVDGTETKVHQSGRPRRAGRPHL